MFFLAVSTAIQPTFIRQPDSLDQICSRPWSAGCPALRCRRCDATRMRGAGRCRRHDGAHRLRALRCAANRPDSRRCAWARLLPCEHPRSTRSTLHRPECKKPHRSGAPTGLRGGPTGCGDAPRQGPPNRGREGRVNRAPECHQNLFGPTAVRSRNHKSHGMRCGQ